MNIVHEDALVVNPTIPAIYTNGNGHQPEPPAAEHLTDLGNARRFTRLHGHDLRYTQATGWLVWTGSHWQRDETGQVARLAKTVVMGLHSEAAAKLRSAAALQERIGKMAEDDPGRKNLVETLDKLLKIAQSLGAWALKSQGRTRVDALIALAQTELPIAAHVDDFDKNPWLFNVRNGTLDLKTGRLHPHRQTDLITKYADVTYDVDAICPRFLSFINKIMAGNKAIVAFLQRAFGYSLIGEVRTNDLFFAYGSGSNGKSTLFEVVTAAMGDYWLKSPTEMLMAKSSGSGIPNDVARLRGVRMTVVAEVEQGHRLAEKTVKDLTGGDTITARFMRKEFFDFKPTHKVWMYGNHKPEIKGRDHGIWRRVHLIPFTVTIPEKEQNTNLKTELLAELPGILAWMVQGCIEWQQSGLCVPDEVKTATEQYRSEGDTMARFVAECADTNENGRIRATVFRTAYERWCQGYGYEPINPNDFWDALEKIGVTKDRSKMGMIYAGIALVEGNTTKD